MCGCVGGGGCRGRESTERSFDVARHTDGYGAGGEVVFDGEADISVTGPVFFDSVGEPQHPEKVFDIRFIAVLDAKVVDHKGEGDGPCCMSDQAAGVRCLVVVVTREEVNEPALRDEAGLFETIDAFGDFNHGEVAVKDD